MLGLNSQSVEGVVRIWTLLVLVATGCGSEEAKLDETETLMTSCLEYVEGMARAFAICEGEEDWATQDELTEWVATECDGLVEDAESAGCMGRVQAAFDCGNDGGWASFDCENDSESPAGCEAKEQKATDCFTEG
jgi:hypothetical protein